MESDRVDLTEESDISLEEPTMIKTFKKWYLNKHFEIELSSITKTTYNVKCLRCMPKIKILHASLSTTNLLKHLQRFHSSLFTSKGLEDEPSTKKSFIIVKKKTSTSSFASASNLSSTGIDKSRPNALTASSTSSASGGHYRQINFLEGFQSKGLVSQQRLDELVINFVVEGMHSLSIVEEGGFRHLIKGLQPQRHAISRDTLGTRIDESYVDMKTKLINILNELEYVGTTTDVWSAHHHGVRHRGGQGAMAPPDFTRGGGQ